MWKGRNEVSWFLTTQIIIKDCALGLLEYEKEAKLFACF